MGSRGRQRGRSAEDAEDPAYEEEAVEAEAGDAEEVGAPGRRATRGRADRRRAARRAVRRRRRSLLREIPMIIVVALGITLMLQSFLVQVFSIPSGSMQATIQIGDRVVVNKLAPWFGWNPHRGDIVVFKDPGNWLNNTAEAPGQNSGLLGGVKAAFTFVGLLPSDRDLIKRVIGVPGDHVVCCDKNGRITVNGIPLYEMYLYPGNAPSTITFDVKVPAGHLWVMGDHRAVSADSRYHMTETGGGFVPETDVVGRAEAIVWPISRWQLLNSPADFAGVPNASGAGASAVLSTKENLGQASAAAAAGPLPAELPLVMGMAAAWPRVRARWRRRR